MKILIGCVCVCVCVCDMVVQARVLLGMPGGMEEAQLGDWWILQVNDDNHS